MKHLAIYGGTFDPVHLGHLHTAMAIQSYFHFATLQFVPCKLPVHKPSNHASAAERLHMLQLTLHGLPKAHVFEINDIEITRKGPSYMVDTLQQLRAQHGTTLPITLILGEDAFLTLMQWHQWQHLFNLAHMIIMKRQNPSTPFTLPQELSEIWNQRLTTDPTLLLNSPSGHLFHFDAGDYPISSTHIRTLLAEQKDVSAWVSGEVLEYIQQNKLYRPTR